MRAPRLVGLFMAGALLATVPSAYAQNPFVIDGVVPANGSTPDPPERTDPFGSVAELGPDNSNTTKVGVINRPQPPMLDFESNNGQTDLRRTWLETKKAANGHIWLYFAWERDANSGSGFISIEFEQNPLAAACNYATTGIDFIKPESAAETALINACNPWAGRKAGDFMLLWDQSGSSQTILKRVFSGTAPLLTLGGSTTLGTAVAAFSADGFRGEMAIDLTVDVFTAGCQNFANIIPGTVTGNSDTADYKDTVLARFDPVSNCGTLTVKKVTTPAGGTGSFVYTVDRPGSAPLDFKSPTPSTTYSDTLTGDGDADTYTGVREAQDFRLAETAPASPWQLDSIACVFVNSSGQSTGAAGNGTAFTVEAGRTTLCTITNKRLQGKLTVIKTVINDNGGTKTASQFSISLGDNPTTPKVINGSPTPGESFTYDVGQTFNVVEDPTTAVGYSMSTTGTCSGTIASGSDFTCTVINDDIAPSLTLIKVVTNDNGGTAAVTAFTLKATMGGVDVLSGTSGVNSASIPTFSAGTYSLSETAAAAVLSDYENKGWVCVGGSQTGANITLGLGQSATCTVTNDDKAATTSLATVMSWILKDSVTLTGFRTGANTGSIIFTLYQGTTCVPTGTPGQTSTQIAQETIPNINQGGTFNTPTGKTVLESDITGNPRSKTFSWVVKYTGDVNNLASETACGDERHTITIP